MMNNIEIAGTISFGGKLLNVYGDLDAPLFKAKDISHVIEYSSGNEWKMLEMCEEDEKLKLPLVVAGQRRSVNFVTENGLYNILSQSRMEIARGWRRVVHDELISMRRAKGRNVVEQFDEWDHALDNIYFDEETGRLMQSVTVQGGDVEQIPYEESGDE
jgi:prophage antirepressor-like protein